MADRERLDALARAHSTVAGKIRALAAAGVPRADIARFLGKRYQHVRNVLEGDAQAGSGGSGGFVLGKADLSGVQDGGRAFDREDDAAFIERRSATAFWIEVKPDGTLPLPPEIVEVLGGGPGERVFATIADGRVTLKSGDAAMEDARSIVRKYIKPGSRVVDEFLAERRAMWGEDDDDGGS
jgi:hypothetical protein